MYDIIMTSYLKQPAIPDTPVDGSFRIPPRLPKRPTVTVLIPTPTSANDPVSPMTRLYVGKRTTTKGKKGGRTKKWQDQKRREQSRGQYQVLYNTPPSSPASHSVCSNPFSSPPPSPSNPNSIKIWV